MARAGQLVIDELANRCVRAGKPSDAVRTAARLDRLARERLPAALSQLAAGLDDGHVYRVRHLEIELGLDGDAMTDSAMSQAWASALMRALVAELRAGRPGNVYRYESPAHFFADFIVHLVRGDAWQRWEFAEFGALETLDTRDALVELLPSRPDHLPVIAGQLIQQRLVPALLAQLGAAHAARIIGKLSERLDDEPVVDERMRTLHGYVPIRTARAADEPSLRVLDVMLSLLAGSLMASSAGALCVARDLASLEGCAKTAPGSGFVRRLIEGRGADSDDALAVLMKDRRTDRRVAALHALSAGSSQGRAYVAALAELAISGAGRRGSRMAATARNAARGAAAAEPDSLARDSEFTSQFAGLALLLMPLADLKWHSELTPEKIRAVFLELVSPERRSALEREPLLMRFFPDGGGDGAGETGWPALDPGSGRLGAAAAASDVAGQNPAAATQLAAELAHRFAARLAGLERSSLDYLRSQFLERFGLIRIDEDAVEVRIAGLPLGVVLRMAGMTGWQGRLPWLAGRDLFVELT